MQGSYSAREAVPSRLTRRRSMGCELRPFSVPMVIVVAVSRNGAVFAIMATSDFDSDAGALSGYEVDEHVEHDDSLHFATGGGGLRGSKSTPALSDRWADRHDGVGGHGGGRSGDKSPSPAPDDSGTGGPSRVFCAEHLSTSRCCIATEIPLSLTVLCDPV